MSTPVAAFGAAIYVTGQSTADTGEATTHVSGSSSTSLYQVTSTAKRVWDPTVAPTIKDGGTPVSASSYVWNPLGGTIYGYAPSGALTVDGSYFPIEPVALCNSFELNGKNTLVDTSNFDGSGAVERTPTVCDVDGSLHVLEDLLTVLYTISGPISITWNTIFSAQVPVVIAINVGSSGSPLWIKFFAILESTKVAGKVADVLQSDLSFKGAELGGAFNSYFGP